MRRAFEEGLERVCKPPVRLSHRNLESALGQKLKSTRADEGCPSQGQSSQFG